MGISFFLILFKNFFLLLFAMTDVKKFHCRFSCVPNTKYNLQAFVSLQISWVPNTKYNLQAFVSLQISWVGK